MIRIDAATRIVFGSTQWPETLRQHTGAEAPRQFLAFGNSELLDEPLTAFFCSVSCPGNLMLKALDWIGKARDEDIAIVSGFHSPVEQQALNVLLRGKQPVVICPARTLTGMTFRPDWEEAHKRGRLLLLSIAADSERRITAAISLARNRFVVALAERVVIAHAESGSKTEALARYAISLGKPTLTFSDNRELLAIGATSLTEGEDRT
jgi:predicted Rossmann fold nucleotide-binding protein DprA/Smf involved in DNA uptake